MLVKIKRRDTKPIDATLTANDKGVPLTGATVVFNMAPKVAGTGSTVTRAPVEITDEAKGKVRWTPQANDVDAQGVHRAEFEVVYSDGVRETFPNGEYLDIEIVEDLG